MTNIPYCAEHRTRVVKGCLYCSQVGRWNGHLVRQYRTMFGDDGTRPCPYHLKYHRLCDLCIKWEDIKIKSKLELERRSWINYNHRLQQIQLENIFTEQKHLRSKIRKQLLKQHLELGESRSDSGFLYVITNPTFSGWCKIGITHNIESRLRQYQTGDPFRSYEVVFSDIIDNKRLIESQIKQFCTNRTIEIRGEWYKLPVSEASGLVTKMVTARLDFLITDKISP